MGYILTSIAFFLFSIRSIFFWTFLWQKNGYRLGGLLSQFKKYSQRKKLFHAVFTILFLFLMLLYVVVVVNDAATMWYQLIVAFTFFTGGAVFIQEIIYGSFIKPIFTVRALAVSLLSVFIIAVLYMIPLVDSFLWIVFLAFVLPILVAVCVVLLAFPSEIYTDYVYQKAMKKMRKNKTLYSIAIMGEQSRITKRYLYELLKKSYKVVQSDSSKGFLDIVGCINRHVDEESEIFIFEIQAMKKDEIKQLSHLVRLGVLILTDTDQSIEEDEKNMLLRYKEAIYGISKTSNIFSPIKNTLTHQLIKNNHRKILLYGSQKTWEKRNVSLYVFDEKIKRGEIWWKAKIGKEVLSLRTASANGVGFMYILPGLYIAKKLGISLQKIQNIVRVTNYADAGKKAL